MRTTPDPARAERFLTQTMGTRSVALSTSSGSWVVPVDDRKAALAAWEIYRPVRVTRTIAWHGARVASWAGVLGAVARSRHTVRPSFIAALGEILGAHDLHPSIWMPPEGDRAVVCAASRSGRVMGFAKIAFSAGSRARLARERHVLSDADDRPSHLLAWPRLLYAGEIDCVDALVLSPANGGMGLAPWRLDGRRVRALASLVRHDRRRPFAELVTGDVPDREPWSSFAGPVHEALQPWWDRELPVAFVHGDFTPWNVMNRGHGVVAVDWEDADPEGIPYWDAWHFATQAAALGGAGSAARLVRAALGGGGKLGRALETYAGACGVPISFARPTFLAYLAASLATVTKHGGDPQRADRVGALAFRRRVLDRLLTEWR
jgi:Phosphotransferase enzyme family